MESIMSLSRWVPTRFTSWPLSASGNAIAEAMIPEPSTLTFVKSVLLLPSSSCPSARVLLNGARGKAPDRLFLGEPPHDHGHDYREARERRGFCPELGPKVIAEALGDRA